MFIRITPIEVLTSIVLCCICGWSAAQNIQRISLRSAIDSAMQNYPALKSKGFLIERANAILNDAHHLSLPSLKLHDQLDLGTSNGIGGSYFPLSIIPSTSGGIRQENNTDVFSGNIGAAFFEHELYNFGLNNARTENAQSIVNSSKADYDATSYSLQYQIAQLYFYLLKYKLLTGIQQKNIDRNLVLYNYIKAYTGSGMKAGVDSSVAYAEVSKAKIQYIQTLEHYNLLKSELAYYIGLDRKNFEIDTTFYNLPDSVINSIKIKVARDSADLNHPILSYFKSRWETSLTLEKLTQKSYLPKIYLIGAAWIRGSSISSKDTYQDLSAGLNYSRYNYLAGLAVTYNLFDLVHQKDKVAIQFYQSRSAYEDFQEQKLQLNKQLQQADIRIQSVLDRQREIPNQLKAAQDAFAQKSAQYNAGLANISELTDANYLLYRAESDAVEVQSDLLSTLLQKAVTNNTLNDFLLQFKQ